MAVRPSFRMRRWLCTPAVAGAMLLSAGFSEKMPAQPRTRSDRGAQSAAESPATWRFAVSGDSRNCGDIVMPAIAASAKNLGVGFYWHLGDFRNLYNIDEDISRRPGYQSKKMSLDEYRQMAWQDFITYQLDLFKPLPVYLGIGNHELGDQKTVIHTRADYIQTFRSWLDQPALRRAREADGTATLETYYHWTERDVDFINLDDASIDQFDANQMAWFHRVMGKDESDSKVQTIVVGMHEPLPNSISFGHSMSESGKQVPIDSGREVYREMLKAQNGAHKKVYILASHSHYYMNGIFGTEYWRTNGGVLPGWIVGTAGAQRYALPDAWRDAQVAIQNVYGYLLAIVNPRAAEGQPADGTIWFEYKLLNRSDVPSAVEQRFGPALVDFCFEQNIRAKPL
ncbi:MAG TPA: hypothetical protein VI455_04390 [Terriglobia bacterium]